MSQSASCARVLVVEDDAAVAQGLRAVLDAAPEWEIAHVAGSLTEAHAWLDRGLPFDVALVDLGLGDGSGLEAIERMSRHYPSRPLIAFTQFDDPDNVFAALRAGAIGYLLKSTPLERLSTLLTEAMEGGSPLSPSVARKIVGAFSPLAQKSPLTTRETEVLRHLAAGATYTDVASAMDVQLSTVQTHVKNLYRKLQVKSRGEAEEKARRLGVLPGSAP